VKAAAGGAGPPSGQIRPYCAASHARHQKIFTITIVIKIRRTMINILMMMMTIVAKIIDHSSIDSFNTDSSNDNDNEDEIEHENENENENVDDDDTDDNNHD